MHISKYFIYKIDDTLAEWLTRWPAKPVSSGSVSSNLTGVDSIF